MCVCVYIYIYIKLHFQPCFLFAAVSFVILYGIVDDCSDGSVMTVVCSSVSDFRTFPKDVKFVKKVFVDNIQVHFVTSDESLIRWLKLCG